MNNPDYRFLKKSSKELLDVIDAFSRALEDNRITWFEGAIITPQAIQFILTLKDRHLIVEEWKKMKSADKFDLAIDYLKSIGEKINNITNDLISRVIELIELNIQTVENFIKSFDIIEDIKKIRLSQTV